MPVTTPDSIAYPDRSWTSGIVSAFAVLASSIQTALSKRGLYTYTWSSAALQTAQTGMVIGSQGYRTDLFKRYTYNGTAWDAIIETIEKQNQAIASATVPTTPAMVATLTFASKPYPTVVEVEVDVSILSNTATDRTYVGGLVLGTGLTFVAPQDVTSWKLGDGVTGGIYGYHARASVAIPAGNTTATIAYQQSCTTASAQSANGGTLRGRRENG